jgi:BolA family transcriptional regulator, general stress-responsive regulator
MSISALIKQKITDHLNPAYYELHNESEKHAGHAGHDGSGESHFRLFIVSSRFEGYNRIARHRMIYEALDGLFCQGLHALSIRALTPSEHKSQ